MTSTRVTIVTGFSGKGGAIATILDEPIVVFIHPSDESLIFPVFEPVGYGLLFGGRLVRFVVDFGDEVSAGKCADGRSRQIDHSDEAQGPASGTPNRFNVGHRKKANDDVG